VTWETDDVDQKWNKLVKLEAVKWHFPQSDWVARMQIESPTPTIGNAIIPHHAQLSANRRQTHECLVVQTHGVT
jgi:hypothetical protein